MATPTLFTGILGVLVAMTIVLFIIAQNIVEPDLKLDDPRVAAAIQERIRPIGRCGRMLCRPLMRRPLGRFGRPDEGVCRPGWQRLVYRPV